MDLSGPVILVIWIAQSGLSSMSTETLPGIDDCKAAAKHIELTMPSYVQTNCIYASAGPGSTETETGF